MADAMLAHQLRRAPQRLSRPDKHRPPASKLAGGRLQLTARRRARKLDVRHDPPALPGHVAGMTAERFDQPRPWIVPPAVYRALHPLLRRAVHGRQRLALEHTQVFIPYLNIGVRRR